MAPSLLQAVWISCRATPCQEMGERKEERKRERRERWSVVVPEEEAWMTQATGFCNQKGRERGRDMEGEERERQTYRRQRRAGTHPLL